MGGTSLMAVELTSASNHQLLDEVSRRMNGGGSAGTNAAATYVCVNNELKISLIGATTFTNKEFDLRSNGKCEEQMTILNANKSKIYGLTLAAVCENGDLKRFTLYPSGNITELEHIYLGSYEKCIVQAKTINEN